MITSLQTISSILTSLPTVNTIPLKQPSSSCIHDHLINAIGSQKNSCLCLLVLDLSAAFDNDTIGQTILITRLSSWFGIHGSVLNYGLSLTYHLAHSVLNVINASISSSYSCLCSVPQGSVLGPLLISLCTPLLLLPISSLSLLYH